MVCVLCDRPGSLCIAHDIEELVKPLASLEIGRNEGRSVHRLRRMPLNVSPMAAKGLSLD